MMVPRTIAALILAVGCLLEASWATESAMPFFAFDNGVGRGAGWSAERQATLLAELGYDGIGLSGVDGIRRHVAAFESRGLKVYSCYVRCGTPEDVGLEQQVEEHGAFLAEHGVALWLTVPPSLSGEEAVAGVRRIVDKADRWGVRVVLYPHHGFRVATLRDALELAEQIDRSSLGVSVNLCHELRAGSQGLPALIAEAGDRLMLASINGADPRAGRESWDGFILPLAEGTRSAADLLEALRRAGYSGPIGLQAYSIEAPPHAHLSASYAAWCRLTGR